MHRDDFLSDLRSATHEGAFGNDYHFIDEMAVVWKFPSDAFKAPGIQFDMSVLGKGLEVPVGEYMLVPDAWFEPPFASNARMPLQSAVTKWRTVDPSQIAQHRLVHENGSAVAAISTMVWASDYWSLSPSEMEQIRQVCANVYGYAGVRCFPCHGMHHVLVFYEEEGNGNLVTPSRLRELLDIDPRLGAYLQIEGVDQEWCKTYGSTGPQLQS